MDLACTERIGQNSPVPFAAGDPVIFRDPRVIENLLSDEILYIPGCNYFEDVQKDIAPYMRKVVTTWMLEVCEEQCIEDQVLPLAVNYLDRFLCVCPIQRTQLQLLAATCLLVASKVRCCTSFHVDLLCAYTDYSVTPEHIMSWEVLLLSKLQWNLAAVTGFDYIDQLIERYSWGQDSQYLRRHAHTLVSICYTETSLIQTAPSLIAAACLCSASRGLKMAAASGQVTRDLCTVTGCCPVSLELLVRLIDNLVSTVAPPQSENKTPPNGHKQYISEEIGEYESPQYGQPVTPKDVEEIYF